MSRNEIFEKIKETIGDIMEIDISNITEGNSLKELGANSIDRADIIVKVLDDYRIKIPMMSFSKAKNIEGIIDVIEGNL